MQVYSHLQLFLSLIISFCYDVCPVWLLMFIYKFVVYLITLQIFSLMLSNPLMATLSTTYINIQMLPTLAALCLSVCTFLTTAMISLNSQTGLSL